MRTLSIEDIKENPWNVMLYPLPAFPSRHLLLVAQIAATCYREVASEKKDESERIYGGGELWPPEVSSALDDWWSAHRKVYEIVGLLEERFGVPDIDFNLSRRIRKFSVIAWFRLWMWTHWKV